MNWRLLPLGILATVTVLVIVESVEVLRLLAATGVGYFVWDIGSSITRRK
jgi:hypothetical protein